MEKPLHVQVAEALGCKPKDQPKYAWEEWQCGCPSDKQYNFPHSSHQLHNCHDGEGLGCERSALARYDTDWSATGPLIEKYGIELHRTLKGWAALGNPKVGGTLNGIGETPLVAVCDLFVTAAGTGLAIKEAGKLAKPHEVALPPR